MVVSRGRRLCRIDPQHALQFGVGAKVLLHDHGTSEGFRTSLTRGFGLVAGVALSLFVRRLWVRLSKGEGGIRNSKANIANAFLDGFPAQSDGIGTVSFGCTDRLQGVRRDIRLLVISTVEDIKTIVVGVVSFMVPTAILTPRIGIVESVAIEKIGAGSDPVISLDLQAIRSPCEHRLARSITKVPLGFKERRVLARVVASQSVKR